MADNVKRLGHRQQIFFTGNSRTKQSFREEVDINAIVARARVSGGFSHVNTKPVIYGDFTTVPDYMSALLIIKNASTMFEALPAVVRDRFANDPGKLMVFVSDPANADEARSLGLLKPLDVVVPPAEGNTPLRSNSRGVVSDARAHSEDSTEPHAPGKGKQGGSK